MKKFFFLLFPGLLIYLTSCEMEPLIDVQSTQALPGSTVAKGLNPEIIPDEYIVIFKEDLPEMQSLAQNPRATVDPQARSSHSMPPPNGLQDAQYASRNQAIKAMMTQVLEENGLPTAKVSKTYDLGSRQGGLIKTSNQADIQKLKKDSRVAVVEQNEVIALELNPGAKGRLIPADDGPDEEEEPYGVNKVGGATDMRTCHRWVFIIDSGIDMDHPDLNVNTRFSRSFVDGDSDPNDGFGHGTHVAGIIGAKDDGQGLVGVAAGVTLVAYKVLDDQGYGTKASLLAAIAELSNITIPGDVVNISLGTDKSEALKLAIETAKSQRGIYFAISAGNEAMNTNAFSPADISSSNVHIIGSVDRNEKLSSFSNYGTNVHYLSYGSKVYSTYKDGMYCTLSGTSMAAPHVAGLLLVGNGQLGFTNKTVNLPSGNVGKVAYKATP
jgi:hypothetical protein